MILALNYHRLPVSHGWGYPYGCRCDLCRAGNNDRKRARRARRYAREGIEFSRRPKDNAWTHESAIEAVAAWMREHGRAPLRREGRAPLPAASTMDRRGLTWTQLVTEARALSERRSDDG